MWSSKMAKKTLNYRKATHPQAILQSTQKGDPNSLDCMLECGQSKSQLCRAWATAISKQIKQNKQTKTFTKNTHFFTNIICKNICKKTRTLVFTRDFDSKREWLVLWNRVTIWNWELISSITTRKITPSNWGVKKK